VSQTQLHCSHVFVRNPYKHFCYKTPGLCIRIQRLYGSGSAYGSGLSLNAGSDPDWSQYGSITLKNTIHKTQCFGSAYLSGSVSSFLKVDLALKRNANPCGHGSGSGTGNT
jgi:hypothetical protein